MCRTAGLRPDGLNLARAFTQATQRRSKALTSPALEGADARAVQRDDGVCRPVWPGTGNGAPGARRARVQRAPCKHVETVEARLR
jgi:hypothetical protein